MTEQEQALFPPAELPEPAPAPAPRKAKAARARPGERREQILQALAHMLEQPGAERITTAALARRLQVSEAALYRHFASKAQMYEALIDFIESSIFTLVRQITEQGLSDAEAGGADAEDAGRRSAARIVAMVLQFAERNPGMASVMAGDALVLEHERLRQRMALLMDKIEAQLRQCLRPLLPQDEGIDADAIAAPARASVLVALIQGRLQQFVRSGFRRRPTEHLQASLQLVL